ncbi:ABC-2 type transport system permease protein [Anaerotaenia torta]|uniref:ABC transporter permease n=1 Tax=Anaerotaenia torta TaxID=433293 RepID=UPI003D1FB930
MSLYLKFFLIHLKSEMQYKASFLFLTAGNFLMQFSTFLGVYFMFYLFHDVDGFTYPQVLLCFAVVIMAFSFAEMFGSGFERLSRMLANGEFDRALVRPRNITFQILVSRMSFFRIGATAQSAIVLFWAVPNSGVVWTWDKILTLSLMIICGSIIFSALFLIQATFAFFTTEGLEFMNILTYGGRDHGRYPYSIYGQEVLRFLTFVIPLALFQYYPLLYLLDMEQSVFYMMTPLLGLLFLIPGYIFFRFGLRRYKSTGS